MIKKKLSNRPEPFFRRVNFAFLQNKKTYKRDYVLVFFLSSDFIKEENKKDTWWDTRSEDNKTVPDNQSRRNYVVVKFIFIFSRCIYFFPVESNYSRIKSFIKTIT